MIEDTGIIFQLKNPGEIFNSMRLFLWDTTWVSVEIIDPFLPIYILEYQFHRN